MKPSAAAKAGRTSSTGSTAPRIGCSVPLHKAMKAILPHAIFIGFTGTPLLKADKQKSVEVFGGYIHTYKFNEAVRDGVALDLRYEAHNIDLALTSPERVDQWFAAKTRRLTDIALVKEQRDY